MTATEVLSALGDRGLKVVLLSGDNPVVRGGQLEAGDPLWEHLLQNRLEIIAILKREAWQPSDEDFFPGIDPGWSQRLEEARKRRGER